jgi:tetratricopeptide (TPR) repeat protein
MAEINTPDNTAFRLFSFIPARFAPLLLAVLACIVYANSVPNQYALDDFLVLVENRYVQQGFEGLPTIFTSDIFASYFEDMGAEQVLSGGRYRPLAQATFAIEYQFFGLNPAVSHIVNVLLYGLLIYIMFIVLLRSFRLNTDLVFITCLLFAVHPVHTEVVSNIKSRDEILSLIFILLGFQKFFSYYDTAKLKHLVFAALFIFLAFLSKEYAYALVVLLPLALFIFRKPLVKKNLVTAMMVMDATAIAYTLIRISIVGFEVIEQNDVLNNPYLHASEEQALATKIFVLSKYLLLLVFPHPLSSDYSYPQIAYLDFGSWPVWLSLLLYITIAVIAFYYSAKKHLLGFALMFYLLCLFPVSNLLLDIGATMGERLIFHSSLGFCLVLGWLLVEMYHRFEMSKLAVIAPLLLVTTLAAGQAISRNPDWYNTDTLFLKDVQTVPLSVIANNNAADAIIKKADKEKDPVKKRAMLEKGRAYSLRALAPYPEFCNALINLGLAEHLTGQDDSAMKHWLLAKGYLPQSPHFPRLAEFFYNKGMNEGLNNVGNAKKYFRMSIGLDSTKSAPWSNLGGAYYTQQKYDSAFYCWQTALKINPSDAEAQRGYNALMQSQSANAGR